MCSSFIYTKSPVHNKFHSVTPFTFTSFTYSDIVAVLSAGETVVCHFQREAWVLLRGSEREAWWTTHGLAKDHLPPQSHVECRFLEAVHGFPLNHPLLTAQIFLCKCFHGCQIWWHALHNSCKSLIWWTVFMPH